MTLRALLLATAATLSAALAGAQVHAAPVPPAMHYKHFKTAIYIPVGVAHPLADPKVFAHQFARAMSQVPFDKVYLEVYRDRQFATDAEIDTIKKEFEARGIELSLIHI